MAAILLAASNAPQAQTADLQQRFEKYKPRLIVLYVGGNDVHNGRSAAQVLADFQAFVARVRATLPGVHVVYSSTTPGPGRWDEAPQRVVTNRAIREYIANPPDLAFVDLWEAMLTPAGQPREELWVEDRVHPNHAGYLIRVKLAVPLRGPVNNPAKRRYFLYRAARLVIPRLVRPWAFASS